MTERPPGPTIIAEPSLPVSRAHPRENPPCWLLFSGAALADRTWTGGENSRPGTPATPGGLGDLQPNMPREPVADAAQA